MDLGLANKVAIVTGSGGGIGEACVRALADEGAVTQVFIDTVKATGEVSILVNNAGRGDSMPFKRMDVKFLRAMLEVNLVSTFMCTKAVLPAMQEKNFGRIINIASTAGLLGYRYVSAYVAAKHAVVGMTRALALEPQLLICDEAVSALDLSVRAQVLNLLEDLQEKRGLAYLFITHDLALVRTLAHRVAVMEAGRIVETGDAAAVIAAPSSAMGRALVAAAPRLVRTETGKAPA